MAPKPTDKDRKRQYTVREGQTVRLGVRITEKEMDALGLPTQKKSITYTGGDTVELTDREAMAMRHALEDAPELTDAEVEMYAEQARQMGDDNPDKKAIAEAIKTRQPVGGPDFGRLPRSHEVDLMMRANRAQERANKQSPMRKTRDGFTEMSGDALSGGGGANAGRTGGDDEQA